jgi:OCT family organic cation transporter-like MFS transporter 4/5
MMLSLIVMAVTGTCQGFSKNYITFTVFKFFNAFGNAGLYPLIFVIALEMVGKHKRTTAGIIINYFYAIGEALLGLLAWLIRDWQKLQLAISAPALIFIVYNWSGFLITFTFRFNILLIVGSFQNLFDIC